MTQTELIDESGEPIEKAPDQTPPDHKREPRDLVKFEAGGALEAMVPRTPEEYARMAKLLMDAGCVPASYAPRDASPAEVRAKLIIGLMKSVEIGVPPITGLNGIMIVNNRPSVWGDLAMGLIHRSGQLKNQQILEIGEKPEAGAPLDTWPDSYGYKVMFWRHGSETAFTGEFTVGKAKRSNLWMNHKRQPWVNYPEDMLFNRARARAMNRGFSDALHGLGIVEEERDIVPVETPERSIEGLFSDAVEETPTAED